MGEVKRINWIDIAKGIGIVSVVLGHIYIPYVFSFIYMFHMPLFFFLSGFCFSNKNLENIPLFIKKKIKSLYLPMISFEFLGIISNHFLVKHRILPETSYCDFSNVLTVIKTLLLGDYNHLSPLWFLRCLFLVSIFFIFELYIIMRIKSKNSKKIVAVVGGLLLLVISYISTKKPFFYDPSLDAVFLANFYYALGYAAKKYRIINKISNFSVKMKVISVFVSGAFILVSSRLVVVNMYFNRYTNYIVALICGILGCYCVYIVAEFIDYFFKYIKNIFCALGKHSLSIFGLHFYAFKLVTIIIVAIRHYDIEMRLSFPIISWKYWFFYLLAGTAIPLLLSLLWGRIKKLLFTKNKIILKHKEVK